MKPTTEQTNRDSGAMHDEVLPAIVKMLNGSGAFSVRSEDFVKQNKSNSRAVVKFNGIDNAVLSVNYYKNSQYQGFNVHLSFYLSLGMAKQPINVMIMNIDVSEGGGYKYCYNSYKLEL
jgi:hypothetical protein